MSGMIGVTLRIRHGGNSFDAVITPKAAVNFERNFKVSLIKAFAEEQRSEYIYYLAWECMKLAGKEVKPFDGWLDQLEEVEFIWDTDAGPLEETD